MPRKNDILYLLREKYFICSWQVQVFFWIPPSYQLGGIFFTIFPISAKWLILNYNTVHSKDILGRTDLNFKIEYHLYQIRSDKGISSRKLAELSGVSKSTINNIENNRYEPTLLTICMLAEALNVSPEDLYSYKVTP